MLHKSAYLLGILSLFTSFTSYANQNDVYEKLDTFAQVLDKIRTSYVEEITETEVIESAIDGMLTSLDPHSGYLNKDDFRDLTQQTKGEFGGLGIEVTMERGVVKVVAPIEDTPAYKAGIESGDLIIKIDDEDVQGLNLTDAVDKMRGKPGTKIKLYVYRENENRSFDVDITRAVIKIKPVKSRLEANGIGYIRITSFNENTDSSMREHLSNLHKENGKPLTGIVLDLRNNPGGLLNQAVAVVDSFLNDGEIVSTRGRISGQNARYAARNGDVIDGKPIAVLINGGSASASEIVAGALQDHKRGIILGTQSFGKGSVQTIMHLPGGSGIRLTTARYYTPSGRSIQAEGITPDIEVKPVKNIEEISTENQFTEASLRGHLEGTNEKALKLKLATKDDKNSAEKLTASQARKSDLDFQLQRALDVVRALTLYQTAKSAS